MFGDVIEKKPIDMAHVRDILSQIKDQNHEQKVTFEYLSKFAKLSKEDAEKAFNELKEANIPRLKDKHIVKLIDLLPKTVDEVKTIFLKEEITLSKEDLQKILDVLSKYR